jgi:signal transduction histidine kinase
MDSPEQPARTRSIRLMLVVLFVVPMVSLLALWGFAASVTLSSAIQERNYNSQDTAIGAPAEALGLQLTLERLQSFIYLSSAGRGSLLPMFAARRATDAAILAFRRGVAAGQNVIFPGSRPALARFLAALNGLRSLRESIDVGMISPLAAFQDYNHIVDIQYQLYNDLILVNNVPLYQQSVVSVEGGRALELVGREIALVGGALTAGGHMSRGEQALFTQTVGQQRLLMGDVLTGLDPSLRAGYERAYTSQAHARFAAAENAIMNGSPRKPIPVNPATWKSVSTAFLAQFEAGAEQDRVLLTQGSAQVGNRLLREVLVTGILGLLAVGASLLLMVRFGRRISRELTGLQVAAIEMADERLPRVVDRLRRGEDVDVTAESPRLATGKTTEIARVAEAFSTVQRTAVQAAVGQAKLRKGISQVFLNLAWRSQSLLHRQLSMLDAMERRSTEPEALEDLFRLDHLTTRMRRHAEGLTILSGAPPVRGWRHPVPVIDVLRGAVAEVEDYTRVTVITQAHEGVAGAAVADVIHLLAELIENATAYSPPNTQVLITADRVANGFAIEIEDRGLGISADELERFNEQLGTPPEFDLADSDQLGLFVVGQLAARHQITITLRPSPYGGTTAIVLLPHGVVVPERELDPGPGAVVPPAGAKALTSAGDGAPRGAHAAPGPLGDEPPTDPNGPQVWRWTAPQARPLGTVPGGAVGASAAPGPPGLDLDTAGLSPARLDPAGSDTAGLTPAVPAAPAGTGDPVLPAGHAGSRDSVPAAGAAQPVMAGTHLGLPRRVRQASLAPQLRDAPDSDTPAEPAAEDGRSPADSRDFMTSLQQGWQRGRTDAGATGDTESTGGEPAQSPWPPEREGL